MVDVIGIQGYHWAMGFMSNAKGCTENIYSGIKSTEAIKSLFAAPNKKYSANLSVNIYEIRKRTQNITRFKVNIYIAPLLKH